MNKPELEIEEIRDEYYSAFGPAAEEVRRYFEFWEEYAFDNVLNFADLFQTPPRGWRYRHFPVKVHIAFPQVVFEPAAEILKQALRKTRTGPSEYAERVKFLQTGLEHARLTVNLAAIFDGNFDVPEDRLEEARTALQNLVQFRKDHQDIYFSDFWWVTNYWERPRWNMRDLNIDIND